jgi:hypothetical protein
LGAGGAPPPPARAAALGRPRYPRAGRRRWPGIPCHKRFAILHPRSERGLRRSIERHDPLLATLAEHTDDAIAQVDVIDPQAHELAQPEPGRIEQLEDRSIAASKWVGRIGHVEQARDLPFAEVRRQPLFAARRADESGRIAVELPLAAQVAAERADRRQLAGRARTRVAARVQIAHERADVQVIEIRRMQIGLPSIEMGGQEAEEL